MRTPIIIFFFLVVTTFQTVWTPGAMARSSYPGQVATFCNEGDDPVMGNCGYCHTNGYSGCPGSNCSAEQNAFRAGNLCYFCPTNSKCQSVCNDAACDDGIFCNGIETCVNGSCAAGVPPCQAGEICSEIDGCVANQPCAVDADCTDDSYCNGVETCDRGACVSGSPPCTANQTCSETNGCVDLPSDGYTPPADHTDNQEGVPHKPGKEDPYRNGCTDCHGSELTGAASGGIAPSCFSCHGQEWSNNSSDRYERNRRRNQRDSDDSTRRTRRSRDRNDD